MAFTAAKLQLHDGIAVQDGVVPASERLRLVETRDLMAQMLEQARDEAQTLVSQAHEQAQEIFEQANQHCEQLQVEVQEQAQALLYQINQEWCRVIESLEPTVVSIARLAIEQLCAESSLADRLQAAVQVAVRELPEKPIRLHVARGARAEASAALGTELDIVEDPGLASDCVRVDGEYGTCEVNFDVAKTSIINCMNTWAIQATELIQKNLH
jgi:F0F1-type ATP synthase membrane subunit b/b'